MYAALVPASLLQPVPFLVLLSRTSCSLCPSVSTSLSSTRHGLSLFHPGLRIPPVSQPFSSPPPQISHHRLREPRHVPTYGPKRGSSPPSSSSLVPFLSVYIRWSTRSFVSFRRCATPSRYLFPVIQKFATHPIANGDPPLLVPFAGRSPHRCFDHGHVAS